LTNPLDESKLRVLIPASDIDAKVAQLAARIEQDYAGRPLTVLGVLKGSVFFLVDLLRRIRLPLELEFLRASSYGDRMESSGRVELGAFEKPLAGRDVLVVDDILDSGRTLSTIVAALRQAGAASVKTCVLVDKRKPRAAEHEADYAAFDIDDVFIVGYGLDYAERYRNLPHIAVFEANGEAAT
jgi:hypoxanthine phosphoribosyltransferase